MVIEKLFKLNGGSWWLIWNCEHKAWWKPDRRGYTSLRCLAGRYSFDEACEIVAEANGDRAETAGPSEAMVKDDRIKIE